MWKAGCEQWTGSVYFALPRALRVEARSRGRGSDAAGGGEDMPPRASGGVEARVPRFPGGVVFSSLVLTFFFVCMSVWRVALSFHPR